MDDKTIIIVKQGIMSGVYSTLPSQNHDIEILDLDSSGHESPDDEDKLKTRANEIYDQKNIMKFIKNRKESVYYVTENERTHIHHQRSGYGIL